MSTRNEAFDEPPFGKKPLDAVVVGGGIAGLAAAWHLRDRNVVVLEAAERVGGRIRSAPRSPYWLNLGAHVFAGPGSFTRELIEAAGVPTVPVTGRLTAMSLNGKTVKSGPVATYPLRVPMSTQARVALLRAGARVHAAVREYRRISAPRRGETPAERRTRILAFEGDRTFADFIGQLPPDAAAVFAPTIARSSAEPEEVSAGCGIGYFHLVWSRRKGLSTNVMGGSGVLTETLARALTGRVALNAPVTGVVRDGDVVRVEYAPEGMPRTLEARHAVIATPAFVAAAILRDLASDTREALRAIPYGPYVVAALLTDERRRMPWDDIYALATPKRSFNMLFNTASALRSVRGKREPGGSLMVYSGGRRLAGPLLGMHDRAIADTYLADLVDIFPDVDGIVREVDILRLESALPYPRPGRFRVQPLVERSLGNVHLAGDYLGSHYVETAVETAIAAALAVSQSLDGAG